MTKIFYKFFQLEIKRGYIALMSVLIMGAVGIAIIVSTILLGIDASKNSLLIDKSNQARILASSCAEEALEQIADLSVTTGSGSLSLGLGTCSFIITSQNGQNITVNSTGLVDTITRKIKVIVASTTPIITISSWQEVADF